jgi:hypothetical protein
MRGMTTTNMYGWRLFNSESEKIVNASVKLELDSDYVKHDEHDYFIHTFAAFIHLSTPFSQNISDLWKVLRSNGPFHFTNGFSFSV